MKFTIDKSVITKAIARASSVVSRRTTIPILANVALNADGNQLNLRTTDLDMEVSLSVEADVSVAGSTTVPAALLSDIVRKLSGESVQFAMDAEGQSMTVSAGRSRFKLQCLPETDFPDMSVGAFSHSFTVPVADLKKIIGRTKFAMSTEETRYYLNGIYLHAAEELGRNVLRSVATDGHRLARADVALPEGASGMPGVIVPRKTVEEFDKALEGDEATLEISENKVRLTVGNMVLTSKNIDGVFPQYERVIPRENNLIAIADADAIRKAADRVSTVSSERGKAVKMTFADNNLHMEVRNPDSGSAEDDVDIDYPVDQDRIEIGFNSKYCADILNNIQSKRARIQLMDAGSPTVIKDEEGGDTLYVLMPMRV